MNYPSIQIEGAILSPNIFDRLDHAVGQIPADFGLESSAVVKDEIARAWADARDYWRIFQRKLESIKTESPATTEASNNSTLYFLTREFCRISGTRRKD